MAVSIPLNKSGLIKLGNVKLDNDLYSVSIPLNKSGLIKHLMVSNLGGRYRSFNPSQQIRSHQTDRVCRLPYTASCVSIPLNKSGLIKLTEIYLDIVHEDWVSIPLNKSGLIKRLDTALVVFNWYESVSIPLNKSGLIKLDTLWGALMFQEQQVSIPLNKSGLIKLYVGMGYPARIASFNPSQQIRSHQTIVLKDVGVVDIKFQSLSTNQVSSNITSAYSSRPIAEFQSLSTNQVSSNSAPPALS